MHLFNPVEQAVFIWTVGNVPEGVAICGQFTTSVFQAREVAEHGFRTTFTVAANPAFQLPPSCAVCTIAGRVPGLKRGMTFVLWTDDAGYLIALEGATAGESTAGLDFDNLDVELHPAPEAGLPN